MSRKKRKKVPSWVGALRRSGSRGLDRCPICRREWESCKHSVAQVEMLATAYELEQIVGLRE